MKLGVSRALSPSFVSPSLPLCRLSFFPSVPFPLTSSFPLSLSFSLPLLSLFSLPSVRYSHELAVVPVCALFFAAVLRRSDASAQRRSACMATCPARYTWLYTTNRRAAASS